MPSTRLRSKRSLQKVLTGRLTLGGPGLISLAVMENFVRPFEDETDSSSLVISSSIQNL
jgi:hypothetical protein